MGEQSDTTANGGNYEMAYADDVIDHRSDTTNNKFRGIDYFKCTPCLRRVLELTQQ